MKFTHDYTWATITILILGVGLPTAGADGFLDVCSWDAFNPNWYGVGDNPEGYTGAVSDGRYIYFSPSINDGGWHGEVLRFDTSGAFDDVASWATFEAANHGVGSNPKGYWGCVFDGRYVYFVPYRNAGGYHGEVLRYDTLGDFGTAASWAAFDPGANGVCTRGDGYIGATFDGRYVYFSPLRDSNGFYGEILRLDTTGDFESAESWITYDAGADGVGSRYGYAGAIFDGRYVYFVPNATTDTSHHGEVRRYDTTGDFNDPTAWDAFDAGDHGVGDDPIGYIGGVFDGRHVYFTPNWRETGYHGELLRYDTLGDFNTADAWQAFNPGDNGVGTGLEGYHNGVFDGQFVYFVPNTNRVGYHADVLRFDVSGDFENPQAWSTFNPGAAGASNPNGGYTGAILHAGYVYFCPHRWNYAYGQVLRFNTNTCPGDINHDGIVNLSDLAQLLGNYNTPAEATCEDGDLDNDGDVDLSDLAALLGAYGDTCD